MDEPTLGLDPNISRDIRNFIKDLCKMHGKTILLTTHYMHEADLLCDRIAILNKGKLVALGTPEELKRGLGKEQIIELDVLDFSPAIVKAIRFLPNVTNVAIREKEGEANLRVHMEQGGNLANLVDAVTKNDGKVAYLKTQEPTLEDVFIHHTGRRLED